MSGVFFQGAAVAGMPDAVRMTLSRQAPRLRDLGLEMQRRHGLAVNDMLAVLVEDDDGRVFASVGGVTEMLEVLAVADSEGTHKERIAKLLSEPCADTHLRVLAVFGRGVASLRIDLNPLPPTGQA